MFGTVSRPSRRLVLVLAMMAAALLSANRADAQPPTCTISVTAVSFGAYSVFTVANTDSTGTITYRCMNGASNISITLSKGASITYTPRTMSNGVDALTYNLYRTALRTTIWGDGTGTTQKYTSAAPPDDTNIVLTIYGRITALQDVSGGNYADTVSAVINF